jgi:hypothetical protein
MQQDRAAFMEAVQEGGKVNEQQPEYSYRPETSDERKVKGLDLVRSTTIVPETSAQRDPAGASDRRMGRGGRGVLASKISTELRRNGTFSFVGQQVVEPVDLAAIAQVYTKPGADTWLDAEVISK